MLSSFEDFQKLSREGVEAGVQSLTAASKGIQAITLEASDYARRSFEESKAATEKLLGARTLERAIEVQSEYAKRSYEGFVAQATKFNEIFSATARESYQTFEGYATKFKPAA